MLAWKLRKPGLMRQGRGKEDYDGTNRETLSLAFNFEKRKCFALLNFWTFITSCNILWLLWTTWNLSCCLDVFQMPGILIRSLALIVAIWICGCNRHQSEMQLQHQLYQKNRGRGAAIRIIGWCKIKHIQLMSSLHLKFTYPLILWTQLKDHRQFGMIERHLYHFKDYA